ncbi:hypothetical protein GCM10010156_73910 [Planobispora rosea]|uniref:Anti-sigma factor antagonist n=1 Tax=Planobispora rosea TaxID=35762 RepID=A0A8J3SAB9_PLARO|nr:STAS domain-containing protein [Planobispora rosea]GGT05437.1 hypothetical protein GCM10010156_73910 [Planobispora rosea]GIH88960.1 hypothetical protein Pro02_73680 [Planobispora rosea]
MSARLSITEIRQDDPACTVLVLSGDLDTLAALLLDLQVETAIFCGRVRVIIDAHDLVFCDSAGLRALLAGLRKAVEAGGWLCLIGVHGAFERVLRLTGLEAALPIEADLTAALTRTFGIDAQAAG